MFLASNRHRPDKKMTLRARLAKKNKRPLSTKCFIPNRKNLTFYIVGDHKKMFRKIEKFCENTRNFIIKNLEKNMFDHDENDVLEMKKMITYRNPS